jgi:hypothetical protein
MRTRSILAGTVMVAGFGIVPAATAGAIVPGVSLAGVKLGDSAAVVKTKLGAPADMQPGPPGSGVVRYDYPTHNRLAIVFRKGRVDSIAVVAVRGEHVADRTTKGVGLLSTMAAWKKAYPGACFRLAPAPPGCTFIRGKTWMRLQVSGRYGMGWAAPLESIQLGYRR